MISGKFAITLHILTLMARHPDDYLSSEFIASSMNINPVLVRRETGNLKKHKIIDCREGKNGGAKLCVAPESLSLEAIFKITFESVSLGYCKNPPNPECPVGNKINLKLDGLYTDITEDISRKLSAISLLDFAKDF